MLYRVPKGQLWPYVAEGPLERAAVATPLVIADVTLRAVVVVTAVAFDLLLGRLGRSTGPTSSSDAEPTVFPPRGRTSHTECLEVLPGDAVLHAYVAIVGGNQVVGDDVEGTVGVPGVCDVTTLTRSCSQSYHLLYGRYDTGLYPKDYYNTMI